MNRNEQLFLQFIEGDLKIFTNEYTELCESDFCQQQKEKIPVKTLYTNTLVGELQSAIHSNQREKAKNIYTLLTLERANQETTLETLKDWGVTEQKIQDFLQDL